MPFSFRLPVVLGIGLSIGVGAVAWLVIDSQPALSLESPALHAPPAGYQPVGPCIPHLGQPYRQANPQLDSPILFYTGSELTTILYLLKEQKIRDGQSWTLPSELNGLPITFVSMSYSQTNPFPRDNPLNTQFQGPHYQFQIYLKQGPSGARAPC